MVDDEGLDGLTTVPGAGLAGSARLYGMVALGPGAGLAQGAVARGIPRRPGAAGAPVELGAGSALLENGVALGWDEHPTAVGSRTVFGHRCVLMGATVGHLCEIGNGTVLLPGASVGDRCMLGEGTVVAAGQALPSDSVALGRPARVLRRLDGDDLERLRGLRGGHLDVDDRPATVRPGHPAPEGAMGITYEYRGTSPTIDPSATLFDTAEVTGDVHIGAEAIVASGVRIVGDSHGPVRIGARVQILENTVLHLLPDNDLVVDDDVVIGPGAMIHGCHLGAGTVVEPGAVICDWSVIGPGSVVRAGSLVRQRAEHPPRAVLEGFPAKVVATLEEPPPRPPWALHPDDLPTLRRIS